MIGILSAVEALGTMFGGFGAVTLGPVVLQSMEVPDRIPVGGDQMLAVHKLPGGQRVLDAMGRDDSALAWSGILQGPGAERRMHELDGLRQSGTPIVLAFGSNNFTVVVHHFTGDYQRSNWIPYQISCEVVQDNAAFFLGAAISLLGAITADLGSALGLNLSGAASTAISAAQTAVNVAGALSPASTSFVATTTALAGAQAALTSDQVASTGVLAGIAPTGNVLGVTDPSTAPSAFGNIFSAAETLANSVAANAFIGRAAINASNASA